MHELGALRVAGEDDLRAWAAGCSLTFSQNESITCIYADGYSGDGDILTVEIKLAMVFAPVASPPARNPAMLAG